MVQDSFYVDPATLPDAVVNERGERPGPTDVLLRTHTSPMQVRSMDAQEPPLFIVVPGTAYRRDTIDATHLPMFHQVEGLAVAEGISLADLAGTLDHAAKALFGPERRTRLKPDYFPFTEPSVQVDVSCFACDGTGRLADGRRDPICKGTGWIEILGAGMVDPNVFGFIERGYDPETTQGFAFGVGIERVAMLKHGAPDLRLFVENDVRFVEQHEVRSSAVSMNVPMSWLREYCDPDLDPEEVADLLSMRAVEVERVSRLGVPSTDGFVVGRVVSAEQHPNADRLRVCEVETGDGVRTIVCGAPNVAGGQAVAVALPGPGCPTAASSAARSCAASSPTA